MSDVNAHDANYASTRFVFVDATRGAAIAGVVLFHLVWDLEFTGFVSGFAFHPVWLAFGRVLAGTFMFLAGFSLMLAHGRKFRAQAFIKRITTISLFAVTVSVASYFLFPEAFVYYGILHAIAVSSVVGLAFLKLPAFVVIVAGLAVMALPSFISLSALDTRWLAWIGFAQSPASSIDFVPVFPWLGLTLLGVASAKTFVRTKYVQRPPEAQKKSGCLTRSLVWMGRHSLVIYLLHQPILLAMILPVSHLI